MFHSEKSARVYELARLNEQRIQLEAEIKRLEEICNDCCEQRELDSLNGQTGLPVFFVLEGKEKKFELEELIELLESKIRKLKEQAQELREKYHNCARELRLKLEDEKKTKIATVAHLCLKEGDLKMELEKQENEGKPKEQLEKPKSQINDVAWLRIRLARGWGQELRESKNEKHETETGAAITTTPRMK